MGSPSTSSMLMMMMRTHRHPSDLPLVEFIVRTAHPSGPLICGWFASWYLLGFVEGAVGPPMSVHMHISWADCTCHMCVLRSRASAMMMTFGNTTTCLTYPIANSRRSSLSIVMLYIVDHPHWRTITTTLLWSVGQAMYAYALMFWFDQHHSSHLHYCLVQIFCTPLVFAPSSTLGSPQCWTSRRALDNHPQTCQPVWTQRRNFAFVKCMPALGWRD